MCFGNNPGCNCCKQLPLWGSTSLGANDIVRNSIVPNSVQSDIGWVGVMFSGIHNSYYFSENAHQNSSRSYDVIYVRDDGFTGGFGTNGIRQHSVDRGADEFGPYNWEATSALPLRSGQPVVPHMSVGDHGMIYLEYNFGNGRIENAGWLAKDGTWVNEPKAFNENVIVQGVGAGGSDHTVSILGTTATHSHANLQLSHNAPLAFITYSTISPAAATTYSSIGTISLDDVAGEWQLTITPLHTSTFPEYTTFGTPNLFANFGYGLNDELFWIMARPPHPIIPGPDILMSAKFPGMVTHWDIGATDRQGGGCYDGTNTVFFHMDFYPGNIVTFAYRSTCITGSDTIAIWGTQHHDGQERIITMDTANFPLGGGNCPYTNDPVSLIPVPIAGGFAINLLQDDTVAELTQAEEVFPDIADISDHLDVLDPTFGVQRIDTREFYLSTDHKSTQDRRNYNIFYDYVEGVPPTSTVLLADGVNAGPGLMAEIILTSTNPLSEIPGPPPENPDAVFKVKIRVTATEALEDTALDTNLQPPGPEDFAVCPDGTVTHDPISTVTRVAFGEYDVTVPNVSGGASGGNLWLTVANPSDLSDDFGRELSGRPWKNDHYVVNASP